MAKTWGQKILNLFLDQDGDGKAGRIEKNTNGVYTIESEHVEIYKGNTFKAGYVDLTVTSGSVMSMLIRVPATLAFLHINHNTFKVSGAPFSSDFFEGPAYSATGSAVASFNINRTSLNTPLATVFHNPALTDNGLCIDPDIIVGERSGGGDLEGYNEHYVLSGGEDYLFQATNRVGQIKEVSFRMSWFERVA